MDREPIGTGRLPALGDCQATISSSIGVDLPIPQLGGFAGYGPRLAGVIRDAIRIVDKILRGAPPSDIPVEQPTRFEFVINLKTAETLGLTIPASLIARADAVIE